MRNPGNGSRIYMDRVMSAISINRIFTMLGMAAMFLLGHSCSDSGSASMPLQAFTGTIDGASFTGTEIEAVLDSNGIYLISGLVNADAAFNLYFREDGSLIHPVETSGSFRAFTDRIDSLFQMEPSLSEEALSDSLIHGLSELLAHGEDLLAPDRCFFYYQVAGALYFSDGGTLTITSYDFENQRIHATLDLSLVNLSGGRKSLTGTFDDILYTQ